MYDRTLVIEIRDQIIEAIDTVRERCESIASVKGQERLDGICMKLIAVSESLKNIDSITDHNLLPQYPQIEWKKIKGIRDFISHHYFDLDAEVIFDICRQHLQPLVTTLTKIRTDLSS